MIINKDILSSVKITYNSANKERKNEKITFFNKNNTTLYVQSIFYYYFCNLNSSYESHPAILMKEKRNDTKNND